MAFSDAQRKVYELLQNGEAFFNPHALNITEAITAIDVEIQRIMDSDSDILNPVPPPTPPDTSPGEDIIAELETFKTSLEGFGTHTDRISGNIIFGWGVQPDIQQLLSLSKARERVYKDLNASEDDARELGRQLVGSLYNVTDSTFGSYIQYISTITSTFESVSGPIQTPEEVLEQLGLFDTEINDNIAADDATYQATLDELRLYALTYEVTTLNDPQTIGEIIVEEKIGTPALLECLEVIKNEDDDEDSSFFT